MKNVRDLAQIHGTPLWVLEEGGIVDALSELRSAFLGAHVGLASKAIGWPEAVRALSPTADSIMATGTHELSVLLEASVPAPLITWWGAGRTCQEFLEALDEGVRHVVLDSAREVKEFLKASKEHRQLGSVLVRVAPLDRSCRPGYERFGVPLASALAELKHLAHGHFETLGLAYHADVLNQSPDVWARGRNQVIRALGEFSVKGPRLLLDLGGGLPPRSLAGPRGFRAYSSLLQNRPNVSVRLCVGRAAIGDAGSVVCRVVEVKHAGQHRWVLVNAGANVLVPLASARFTTEAARSGQKRASLVADRVSSFGIIDGEAQLPAALRPGDLLVVHRAGAYTWSMRCAAVEGCGTALLINRSGQVLLQSTR